MNTEQMNWWMNEWMNEWTSVHLYVNQDQEDMVRRVKCIGGGGAYVALFLDLKLGRCEVKHTTFYNLNF